MGAAFLVSAAGSVAFAATVATGGQTQIEGAALAVALGGMAAGLLWWVRASLPRGPFVESHEPLASPPGDRRAAEAAARRGVGRRAFLGRLLAAAAGAFGVAALVPLGSLGPAPGGALRRTAWRAGARLVTADGTPVRAGTLAVGGIAVVWPEGDAGAPDAQAVLLRLGPAEQQPAAGREEWSPDGHVAYSRICTHAGCPVGLYQDGSRELFCPCHQSSFDVTRAAIPTSGPAPRPLPQLPLFVDDDGYLRARGGFSEPVGPSTWNVP